MARGRAWKWVAAGIFIIAVLQVVLISLTVSPDEDGVDNVDDGGQPLAGHVHSEQRPLYAVRDSYHTHISAHLSVCTLGLPHFLAHSPKFPRYAFIPQRPQLSDNHTLPPRLCCLLLVQATRITPRSRSSSSSSNISTCEWPHPWQPLYAHTSIFHQHIPSV
jgi:hypothetical protein